MPEYDECSSIADKDERIDRLEAAIDKVIDDRRFFAYIQKHEFEALLFSDNKGFEYYNGQKVEDYIQIPWEEVDYVIASVMFKGKYIPRFAIQTKRNGTFTFSANKTKELLRANKDL